MSNVMNDARKIAFLQNALELALAYLAIYAQVENPEKCAIPVSVAMERLEKMLEASKK